MVNLSGARFSFSTESSRTLTWQLKTRPEKRLFFPRISSSCTFNFHFQCVDSRFMHVHADSAALDPWLVAGAVSGLRLPAAGQQGSQGLGWVPSMWGFKEVKMCTELYGKEARGSQASSHFGEAVQKLVKENSEIAKREGTTPAAPAVVAPEVKEPSCLDWSPKADLLDLDSTTVPVVQHGPVPVQVDDLAEIFATPVPEKIFAPVAQKVTSSPVEKKPEMKDFWDSVNWDELF